MTYFDLFSILSITKPWTDTSIRVNAKVPFPKKPMPPPPPQATDNDALAPGENKLWGRGVVAYTANSTNHPDCRLVGLDVGVVL